MRDLGSGRLRKLPADAALGFVRPAWRRRIGRAGLDRRIFEFCVLAELRDRLRAGDVWVEGSRRYRAVEQQLISTPVFTSAPCPSLPRHIALPHPEYLLKLLGVVLNLTSYFGPIDNEGYILTYTQWFLKKGSFYEERIDP